MKLVKTVTKQPTVSKAKYEALAAAKANAAKRAREVAAKRVGVVAGSVACAAVGWAESTGKVDPKFTSPLALLAAGVVVSMVAPEMLGQRAGSFAAEAGAGIVGIGAYKLARQMAAPSSGVSGDWSDGNV